MKGKIEENFQDIGIRSVVNGSKGTNVIERKVIKITSASDYNRKKRLKTERITISGIAEFVWRRDAIFL